MTCEVEMSPSLRINSSDTPDEGYLGGDVMQVLEPDSSVKSAFFSKELTNFWVFFGYVIFPISAIICRKSTKVVWTLHDWFLVSILVK